MKKSRDGVHTLIDLEITSVDFVDRGANPDAYLCLYKGLNHKSKNGTHSKTKGTNTMKLDKSKMTQEELSYLESLEKKYGSETKTEEDVGAEQVVETPTAKQFEPLVPNSPPPPVPLGDIPSVAKAETPVKTEETNADHSDTTNAEVAKALAQVELLQKAHAEEMEALKKGMELERLAIFCKKYEVLGKKSEELAEKLHTLKSLGGTHYNDHVELLDSAVESLNKSAMFREVGTGARHTAGTVDGKLEALAQEITKRDNVSFSMAMQTAYEEHPELACDYENNYTKGGNHYG